jgi:hypothetical protein
VGNGRRKRAEKGTAGLTRLARGRTITGYGTFRSRFRTGVPTMGKGNNSQGREKKKPKKGAKPAAVKASPPPKKK